MLHQVTRTRPRLLISAALTLVVVTAACSPFIGREGVRMGTDRSVLPTSADSTPGTGLTRKEIAAKEEPSTLFARDRMQCIVDAKRFAKARVGQRVWCMWR